MESKNNTSFPTRTIHQNKTSVDNVNRNEIYPGSYLYVGDFYKYLYIINLYSGVVTLYISINKKFK